MSITAARGSRAHCRGITEQGVQLGPGAFISGLAGIMGLGVRVEVIAKIGQVGFPGRLGAFFVAPDGPVGPKMGAHATDVNLRPAVATLLAPGNGKNQVFQLRSTFPAFHGVPL